LDAREELSKAESRFMEERAKRHKVEQDKREAVLKLKTTKESKAVVVGAQRRAEEKLMAMQQQLDRQGASRQAAERVQQRAKEDQREHQRVRG
jgi:hypothetical protein